ncbi:MAG: hypothetical protein WCI21_03210 [Alphaproteobacteria bacterium]
MIDRRQILQTAAALPLAAAPAWAAETVLETTTLERVELVDPVSKRKVPTRIYYPAKAGRYPVILFSHGFGGALNAFANTGRIWASHGYVVLHPTHIDSVANPDPAVDPADAVIMRRVLAVRGTPDPAARQALVLLIEKPYFLASRLRDIAFLQDALHGKLPGIPAEVLKRCNLSKMGMSGHSYGAYTTLIVSGAKLNPASVTPVPTGFLAGMSISGQGAGRMGLSEASFPTITRPLMAITGTRDIGAANETPPWRLHGYDMSAPGHKYAVVVEGFAHGDFDPAAGEPNAVKGDALHALQLDFWNAALKGQSAGWRDLDQKAMGSKSSDPLWVRTR